LWNLNPWNGNHPFFAGLRSLRTALAREPLLTRRILADPVGVLRRRGLDMHVPLADHPSGKALSTILTGLSPQARARALGGLLAAADGKPASSGRLSHHGVSQLVVHGGILKPISSVRPSFSSVPSPTITVKDVTIPPVAGGVIISGGAVSIGAGSVGGKWYSPGQVVGGFSGSSTNYSPPSPYYPGYSYQPPIIIQDPLTGAPTVVSSGSGI